MHFTEPSQGKGAFTSQGNFLSIRLASYPQVAYFLETFEDNWANILAVFSKFLVRPHKSYFRGGPCIILPNIRFSGIDSKDLCQLN